MSEGWPTPIPVTERLPESFGPVLMWRPGFWYLGTYTAHGFETAEDEGQSLGDEIVTHWLPLPPGPDGWTLAAPVPLATIAAARAIVQASGVPVSDDDPACQEAFRLERERLTDSLVASLAMPGVHAFDVGEARLAALAPIFDAYCKLCGSDRGRDCQCWNDEQDTATPSP